MISELRPGQLSRNLLCQDTLEIGRGERRALASQRLKHGFGITFVNRIAKLVRTLTAQTDDTAMLALILLRPL